MTLEVCYYTGADPITSKVYGHIISSESITLSGTSAQSGTIPSNAVLARIHATENCRFNMGSNPTVTSTTGQYLSAGMAVDKFTTPGHKIAGITA
jgi:hypothetical protein